MFVKLAFLAVLCSPETEAGGGGAAPAPPKPVATITRSELDRHIEEIVRENVDRGLKRMEDAVDGLRKEVLGPERTEQCRDTRDKARKDFEQMSSTERAKLISAARRHVIESKGRVQEERLPEQLRNIGFGRGFLAARYLGYFGQGLVHSRLNEREAHEAILQRAKADGDFDLARIVDEHIQQRSVTAGDAGSAGALIPEIVAADFITALYAQSVVRRAGATTIQLSNGNLTLGKQNASAVSYWIGETDDITASEPTMENIKLSLRTLASLVPISRDALQYVPNVASIIQQDMLNAHALQEDITLLRSKGTENRPRGIKEWLNADNVFAADTGGATLYAKIMTDALKAQFKVENGDVPIVTPAWFTSVREKFGIMSATLDSVHVFMPEILQGSFLGAPFYATTQIPTNIDTNKSELAYSEMSQVIVADGLSVELEQSTDATIRVNGTDVRLFQSNQAAFRLIGKVDLAVRHDRAAAWVENTVYGTAFT